jgi:hypothetical protein
MGFGNGRVEEGLTVDASTDIPTTRMNLRFDAIDLAAFFRGTFKPGLRGVSTARPRDHDYSSRSR